MAKSSRLFFVLAGLLTAALADHHGNDTDSGSNCCKFTLSSTGGFDCPAGELEDGQIRLNGTYDTSTFCIDKEGGITNSRGFGCIVTEEPTTQIQCDQGKKPTKGFSIGSNNTLLYQGSSSFFACPATDTEYNIYVSPNFGQKKCFPVMLQSDGCGSLSCPPPTTVWQTAWYTEVVNQTVMLTQTELVPCSTPAPPPPPPPVTSAEPPPPPPANTTKSCTKCHHPSEGAPWGNKTYTTTNPKTELPPVPSTDKTMQTPPASSDTETLAEPGQPTIQTKTDLIPPTNLPEAKLPGATDVVPAPAGNNPEPSAEAIPNQQLVPRNSIPDFPEENVVVARRRWFGLRF